MAGAMIELKVDAQEQLKLERAMNKLPDRLFQKVVGSAATFAMRAVVTGARQKVPQRSGTLKKSIGTKRKKYKRAGVVVVIVGPRKGYRDPETGEEPAKIAHLVERGAAGHHITANFMDIEGSPVRGTVFHPGAKAQPFLGNTLQEQQRNVLVRYRGKLLQGMEKEIKKLARSG